MDRMRILFLPARVDAYGGAAQIPGDKLAMMLTILAGVLHKRIQCHPSYLGHRAQHSFSIPNMAG